MTVGAPEAFLEEPDEEGRAIVRIERLVDAEPVAVWSMLTDPAELASWFPCEVTVEGDDWTVGTSLTFRFDDAKGGLTIHGTVTEVLAPSRLAYTWGDETLSFTVDAEGSGTRLAVRNGLDKAHAARNAAGWDDCLDALAGTPLGDWRVRFEQYRTEFEPILGPQEGPPPGHLLER